MSKIMRYANEIKRKMEIDDFNLVIEKNDKVKPQVKLATFNLLQQRLPYEDLCWELAEFQLIFEKGRKGYSEKDVCRRAKAIFDSTLSYVELYWLICEFKSYLEQEKVYPYLTTVIILFFRRYIEI